MSTNLVCRGYGILLHDMESYDIPDDRKDLIRDLGVHLGLATNLDLEDILHAIRNSAFGDYFYNGNGPQAVFLGIKLGTWETWELRRDTCWKQGLLGVIRAEPTPEQLAEWQATYEAVVAPVRHILDKHGVKPNVFWTSGSS